MITVIADVKSEHMKCDPGHRSIARSREQNQATQFDATVVYIYSCIAHRGGAGLRSPRLCLLPSESRLD